MTDLDPIRSPAVAELAKACRAKWPTIAKAAQGAAAERDKLVRRISAAETKLTPPDTAIVVFGSLARGEWTQGSDRDWTLLVDGQVDVHHAEVVSGISNIFEEGGKKPGPTGVFGGLTFSDNIVHFIGGDDDTNTNTTRRILLMLESRSLGSDDMVRSRVLKALLDRYIGEDLLYHQPSKFLVPRFLLNDYVRYWRTMAVDSAQKRRDRVQKWALRNIKLRLSRKLIFVAGLWACLSCELHPSPNLKRARKANDRDAVSHEMTQFLAKFSQRSPLETLASAFLEHKAFDAARLSFGAYEDFLKILDTKSSREALEKFKHSDALKDATFIRGKRNAQDFQEGLTALFFDTNRKLRRATEIYGVF